METKKFCSYPEAFKLNRRLNDTTIEYFNLSQPKNLFSKCKDCIYKIRKTCSGAYSADNKLLNKKETDSQINMYDGYITTKNLPSEIKFEITSRCNFSCNFCFNTNSFRRDGKELPSSKIFKIIDNLENEGIKTIRFTGGEPFLRKDIIKIFKYAKSKNLRVKVNTNLTFDKKRIDEFKKYLDYMYISFNLTPKHKNIIDDNYLRKKIILFKELSENNINFGLNTVATKHTIEQLKNIGSIVRSFDCNWTLLRQVPTRTDKNPVNHKDVETLVKNLIEINKEAGKSYHITALPFCAYDPEKVEQVSYGAKQCGPFFTLSISPSGKIKPCYSIDENLGDALKVKISNAWEDRFSADIRELKLFPEICKKCKYTYECLGGCRFAAKLLNGSYSSLDPLAMPEKYKGKLLINRNI